MKRSEINRVISSAKELLEEFRWQLPKWANWTVEEFQSNPEIADWHFDHQLGWDVTDFGSNNFQERGLGLFCLRNGVQSDPGGLPYAEKLLFIGEGQETPFHMHKVKMEDIINRGGGELVVEFRNADGSSDRICVRCDGIVHNILPDEPLILEPGQSVTIPREMFHRFYGKPGKGPVLGGEVSQVNDDGTDNYFLEPLPRFSEIEEDAVALHPLWNEVGAA